MSGATLKDRSRIATGLVFAGALVAAYSAFDFSSFTMLADVNPQLAYTLRPDDPAAFTSAMRQKIVKEKALVPDERDVDNARASLKNGALNRAALRTIGFGEEVKRRSEAARETLELADRLSRRDPLVQIWLIESNRRAGERLKNIDHFAAAMLVEPRLIDVLGPGIVEDLATPAYRRAMVQRIKASPAWADELTTLVAQRADLAVGLPFLSEVAKVDSTQRYRRAYSEFALRMAASDYRDRVVPFLKAAFPKFDPRIFAEAGWNRLTTNPAYGALSWSETPRPGANVDLSIPGSAFISLEPLIRSAITNRYMIVKGGQNYSVTLGSISESIDPSGHIDVVVECVLEGKRSKLAQFRVLPTSTKREFGADFAVPAECGLVNIVLYGRGGDGQFPTEFTLTDLSMAPGRSKGG